MHRLKTGSCTRQARVQLGLIGGVYMSKVRDSKKNLIYEIVALILGLILLVGGVYEIVASRIASHEYKKSTDIREVTAVVADYKIHTDDDDDSYTDRTEYEAKLYFKVEGKIYEGKETYYHEISTGDMVTVTVYKTKKGDYKIEPEGNPVKFLLYCIAIVIGLVLTAAMINSLTSDNSEEKKKDNTENKDSA